MHARVAIVATRVRANSAQWVATCMPVVHIFSPLMIQAVVVCRVSPAPRRVFHVGCVRAVLGLRQDPKQ